MTRDSQTTDMRRRGGAPGGEIVERVNGATGEVDGDQVSVGAAEMAEAARMLRALLAACRPLVRSERATGQRLEGAAAALAVLADRAGPH